MHLASSREGVGERGPLLYKFVHHKKCNFFIILLWRCIEILIIFVRWNSNKGAHRALLFWIDF